eukprot:7389366-Prymnesium_polylepis.3
MAEYSPGLEPFTAPGPTPTELCRRCHGRLLRSEMLWDNSLYAHVCNDAAACAVRMESLSGRRARAAAPVEAEPFYPAVKLLLKYPAVQLKMAEPNAEERGAYGHAALLEQQANSPSSPTPSSPMAAFEALLMLCREQASPGSAYCSAH